MSSEAAQRSLPALLIIGLLRLVWTLVVISVPLAGVWIASSLAALGNHPIWVACLIGALAFPIVPVAWELLGEVLRRGAKARGPKRLSDLRTRGGGMMSGDDRVLTLWDRLILRTLVVNLLFLGSLVWATPETIYSALSARGDWMLEGVDAPWAERLREGLHEGAERFEWLHERTHHNKYEALVDAEYTAPPPPPPPARTVPAPAPDAAVPDGVAPDVAPQRPDQPASGDDPDASSPPHDDTNPSAPASTDTPTRQQPRLLTAHWPLAPEPHPLITALPPEVEHSIAAVATYVVAHETEPFARVKALHDYVATRVRYDTHAAEVGPIPPQDAQTTFETNLSVCAGYANLLAALIEAAGGEAVVIPGHARGMGGELGGEGHAWNAVKIEGLWYLIDATWNAGASQDGKWGFGYSTDYLFVPAEVIGLSHFPEEPGWQLRAQPLTRGEFLRQPMLRPGFFAEGFDLLSPRRSQISVKNRVVLQLANARGHHIIAHAAPELGGSATKCEVERDEQTWQLSVTCELPSSGAYLLRMFSNEQAYGNYGFVGSLSVNASG